MLLNVIPKVCNYKECGADRTITVQDGQTPQEGVGRAYNALLELGENAKVGLVFPRQQCTCLLEKGDISSAVDAVEAAVGYTRTYPTVHYGR